MVYSLLKRECLELTKVYKVAFVNKYQNQEIIIYAGHYLKSLGDVSNLQPTSMLVANANRLTEITCHSPNLINTDLSECTLLQRIDISDSVLLGTGIGAQPILNIQNCKYLRYCNCMNTQLTAIYTMQQGGNLEELYFPETTQVIQVTNQTYLKTIGIPCGYKNLYNPYTDFNSSSDMTILGTKYVGVDYTKTYVWGVYNTSLCFPNPTLSGQAYIHLIVKEYDSNYIFISDKVLTDNNFIYPNKAEVKFNYTPTSSTVKYVKLSFTTSSKAGAYGESATNVSLSPSGKIRYFMFCESSDWLIEANPKNLATVQITNCNSLKYIQYPFLSSDTIKFDSLKYVQNLTITNSMPTLTEMSFRGFNKLRNVTLQNLQNLTTLGFDNMLGASDTSTFKTMTLSNMPKVTKLTFNVDSENYKIAFAGAGKIDMGGLQSALTIESNYSIKGLDTIILPTSIKELRFSTTYGDGINELKNLWSATSNHSSDGFTGIDFQDMSISFIDMLGLSQVSNAINFNIAPVTQHPNMNTNRDGTATKPYFKPTGTINLNNYTGSMVAMLKGLDLSKITIILDKEKSQTDLTSLFQGATITTSDIAKVNNVLAKFSRSTIWDYMFAHSTISSLEGISIGNGMMSLKGWCKGSNITSDIKIPNNVFAADEMFMNCASLTNAISNWNGTYTYGITSTNCYSGCNGLLYIDNIKIPINEYTSGLDEIPIIWGGNGFSKDVTSIIEVLVPSDGYKCSIVYNDWCWTDKNNHIINWGDGTTTINETSHIYNKAGLYTIKGKFTPSAPGLGSTSYMYTYCKKCTQLATKPHNNSYQYMFYKFSNIEEVNLMGIENSTVSIFDSFFRNCPKLTSVYLTLPETANDLNLLFSLTPNVENFSFIKTWDFSNVTNLTGAFNDTDLSVDILLYIINGVSTISNGNMGLGSKNLAKLTNEQKAIAINKGWTLT